MDLGNCSLHVAYLDRKEEILPSLDGSKVDGLVCFGQSCRFDVGVFTELARYIRFHKFDIVVCVEENPMLYVLLIKPLISSQIVVVLHNTKPLSFYHRLLRILYRQSIRLCNKIVFVCRAQMEYWMPGKVKPDEKYLIIYNGVNTDHFKDQYSEYEKMHLREMLGITRGDFVIGICAAMRKEKRHLDLIDAACALRCRGIPAKVLAIGDGPMREAIEAHAVRKGFAPHLNITGYVDNVRDYLAICSCTALASSTEAFPISILESMAMEKPVVASDEGGVRKLITHGETGFIYPSGDIELLSKYLSMIWEDKPDHLGSKARAYVLDNFSLDRMVARYSSLFNRPLSV